MSQWLALRTWALWSSACFIICSTRFTTVRVIPRDNVQRNTVSVSVAPREKFVGPRLCRCGLARKGFVNIASVDAAILAQEVGSVLSRGLFGRCLFRAQVVAGTSVDAQLWLCPPGMKHALRLGTCGNESLMMEVFFSPIPVLVCAFCPCCVVERTLMFIEAVFVKPQKKVNLSPALLLLQAPCCAFLKPLAKMCTSH